MLSEVVQTTFVASRLWQFQRLKTELWASFLLRITDTNLISQIMCVLQIKIKGKRAHLQNQFSLSTFVKNKWGILELKKFTLVENEKCRRVNSLHISMIIIMHIQHNQTCTNYATSNTRYQQNKIDELNENEIEK